MTDIDVKQMANDARAFAQNQNLRNTSVGQLLNHMSDALESLSADRDRLETMTRESVEYATRLAQALHDRHFRGVTHWEPLDDLIGLLMQIDNMTSGMKQSRAFDPDYLCPDDCAAQDALKEQLDARKQDREKIDRLRKDNARLRETVERVRVAAEFHAQDGVSDHVMRYAHESTKRLCDEALAATDAAEKERVKYEDREIFDPTDPASRLYDNEIIE